MSDKLKKLIHDVANGDAQAFEWINIWNQHVNNVDDIVDGELTNVNDIVQAFMVSHEMLLHPFFMRNAGKLYPVLFLCANAYCDSEELRKINVDAGEDDWPHKVSDVLRSYGNEMLVAVAAITRTGSNSIWTEVRDISMRLREISYESHHNSSGDPV